MVKTENVQLIIVKNIFAVCALACVYGIYKFFVFYLFIKKIIYLCGMKRITQNRFMGMMHRKMKVIGLGVSSLAHIKHHWV